MTALARGPSLSWPWGHSLGSPPMCFTNWMRQILSVTNGNADSFSVRESDIQGNVFFYLEDLQPLASVTSHYLSPLAFSPFAFSLDFELYCWVEGKRNLPKGWFDPFAVDISFCLYVLARMNKPAIPLNLHCCSLIVENIPLTAVLQSTSPSHWGEI